MNNAPPRAPVEEGVAKALDDEEEAEEPASTKPGATLEAVETKSEEPSEPEHDGTNAVAATGAKLGIAADPPGTATTAMYSKILLPHGEPDEAEGVASDEGGMLQEVGEDCEVEAIKGVEGRTITAQCSNKRLTCD